MRERCTREDVAAAAAWLVPFQLASGLLFLVAPASRSQLAHADPLVQLVAAAGGAVWTVPIGLGMSLAWMAGVRSTAAALLQRGARPAVAGAVFAVAVALAIHAFFGSRLPDFVPPEESARPGLTLGLAAGCLEEALFRLAILPALYFALRRRAGVLAAAAVASALTGLLFALAHELGPGGGAWEWRHLATRFLFPGVVMSLAFLRIRPAFLVTAHATGHLAIPALFA